MACATAAWREPEIKTRVEEAARILEIGAMLTASRGQFSGGQRQRVAMGRAIVRQPKVFLFDEPLSNLDAKLRIAMRVEIRKLQRRLKTTSIYVTHDQLEAMTLADMSGGDERRPGRADRQSARHLPKARHDLRRFLHRRAADESAADAVGWNQGAIARRRRDGGILGIRPEDFVVSNDAAQATSRSISPWRRSSGSAPRPSSTARANVRRRPLPPIPASCRRAR